MQSNEDYRLKQAKRVTIRAFLPLFGLILIIAFGLIAFIFGPWLTDVVSGIIPIDNSDLDTLDWISRVVIFFALVMIATLLYAISIPKKKDIVSERALDKERKERIKAQMLEKQRKKQVRTKLA